MNLAPLIDKFESPAASSVLQQAVEATTKKEDPEGGYRILQPPNSPNRLTGAEQELMDNPFAVAQHHLTADPVDSDPSTLDLAEDKRILDAEKMVHEIQQRIYTVESVLGHVEAKMVHQENDLETAQAYAQANRGKDNDLTALFEVSHKRALNMAHISTAEKVKIMQSREQSREVTAFDQQSEGLLTRQNQRLEAMEDDMQNSVNTVAEVMNQAATETEALYYWGNKATEQINEHTNEIHELVIRLQQQTTVLEQELTEVLQMTADILAEEESR